MEDFAGLIVLIIIGIISSITKKNKAMQKKAAPRQPIIPYEQPKAVPTPAYPAVNHDTLQARREEQFQQEMQAIREAAREKLAAQRAAEGPLTAPTVHTTVKVNASPRVHTMEGVDPCHDALYDESEAAEPIAGQPAPLEAMEGVDPCHDELYEADAANAADESERPKNEAAQELLRGVILSEVLARPRSRWRTQQR